MIVMASIIWLSSVSPGAAEAPPRPFALVSPASPIRQRPSSGSIIVRYGISCRRSPAPLSPQAGHHSRPEEFGESSASINRPLIVRRQKLPR